MPPKIIVLTETTDLDITFHTAPAHVEVRTLCSGELGSFMIDSIEEKELETDLIEVTLCLKRLDKYGKVS